MPAEFSAGIVLWHSRTGADADQPPSELPTAPDGLPDIEILLVHSGGPHWARRDVGWWTIPKGAPEPGEETLAAAEREFAEELGMALGPGERTELGEVVQKAGKHVAAWAVCGDLDVTRFVSNTFTMEWPPRSGTTQSFPEIDRAAWFSVSEARRMILPAQLPFVDRLVSLLCGGHPEDAVPPTPAGASADPPGPGMGPATAPA